ncbi:MAG TPA: 3-isopropylmalate dehydratase small subunit [Actinomycetota bacterium]|nr:3-isopropylmalate dehydratase small subunit [Actinomycetota bacterium]
MRRAWRYGDNVDTDAIIPARYLTATNEPTLAAHAMEDLDPRFATEVQPGDVIVAGDNFGCGSSREHAAIAIKASGVDAVVAASFARIFFRNAVNTGLKVVVSPEAVAGIADGHDVVVGLDDRVHNLTTGAAFPTEPMPEFVAEIARAGGLVGWVRQRVGAR